MWRKTVQCAYAIFCIFTGWQFYLFYKWATGAGHYVPRPPAVEAFLPISALMSLKRLIITGKWDYVHPAGLAFFIAVLITAVLFRRGFCGWVCPVGLLSDVVERGGRFMRVSLRLPLWLRYSLLCIKYALLGFFTWIILFQMDSFTIESFIQGAYNLTVDAKMLLFFLSPSGMVLGVIVGLVVVSFFVRHFWCTYCCPYGALLGLLSVLSPLHVNRDDGQCKHCRRCEDACPAGIRIWEKQNVLVPECIGCMECIAACPEDRCLKLAALGGDGHYPLWLIPAGVVGLLLAAWLLSVWTGHWHSAIPDQAFKAMYERFLSH